MSTVQVIAQPKDDLYDPSLHSGPPTPNAEQDEKSGKTQLSEIPELDGTSEKVTSVTLSTVTKEIQAPSNTTATTTNSAPTTSDALATSTSGPTTSEAPRPSRKRKRCPSPFDLYSIKPDVHGIYRIPSRFVTLKNEENEEQEEGSDSEEKEDDEEEQDDERDYDYSRYEY